MLPYLFGSILTVTPNDVWLIVALGAVIVVSIAIAGRALFAIVVDEESARVAGLPVVMLNGLLVTLAAVTIVAATQVVGTLLVAALMVLPVALRPARRPIVSARRSPSRWASACSPSSWASRWPASGPLAPGGAIVLVAAAVFLATALATGVRKGGAATLLAGPGH